MTPFLPNVPIIGFAAYSGTGKTTLLELLIPLLVRKGKKIALIKHAHHNFDIDHKGKDSYRFRKAGAKQIVISSQKRYALIAETPNEETSFSDLIKKIDIAQIDLILVEGFKKEAFPKIELKRQALQKPWLYPTDKNIIALACDSFKNEVIPDYLAKLDINQPNSIAHFILNWIENNNNTLKPASCDLFSSSMISVKKAQKRILDTISTQLTSSPAPLQYLRNKVLSENIIAPINVPSMTNSAMDGYAIQSEDCHLTQFKVIGEIKAGYQFSAQLKKGECVQIMTGAPLPENADTVIIKEQANVLSKEYIQIDKSKGEIIAKQNVRMVGEDLVKNSLIFSRGKRLNSADVGMIASLGYRQACIYAPLRVALFSTGDEVIEQGESKPNEKIYDTNRFTLQSLLTKLNCQILDLGILPDNKTAIYQALSRVKGSADLIITSGGVSVGKADYIKSVLEQLGHIDFWRINMRPGRPLAFGHLDHTPFFALPGNPVAVMVTFLLFVEPAIRQMQGEKNWQREMLPAISETDLSSRLNRTEYIRGVYTINAEKQIIVKSTGAQGSGILSSMSYANCLIKIPPERENIKKGEYVNIITLQSCC